MEKKAKKQVLNDDELEIGMQCILYCIIHESDFLFPISIISNHKMLKIILEIKFMKLYIYPRSWSFMSCSKIYKIYILFFKIYMFLILIYKYLVMKN